MLPAWSVLLNGINQLSEVDYIGVVCCAES